MKKLLFAGACLALASCAPQQPPVPTSPHDIIASYLTHQSLHVVDVSMLASTGDTGYTSASEVSVTSPDTLCLSAPYGAAFRAYQPDGKQIIGVVCMEADHSMNLLFQKTLG